MNDVGIHLREMQIRVTRDLRLHTPDRGVGVIARSEQVDSEPITGPPFGVLNVPSEIEIARLVVLALLHLGKDRVEKMIRFVFGYRVRFDRSELATDAIGRGYADFDMQVRCVQPTHRGEKFLDIQRSTDHVIPLSSRLKMIVTQLGESQETKCDSRHTATPISWRWRSSEIESITPSDKENRIMFMRMIYDEKLAQAAYLIGCQATGEAIIIDPERDVDRYIELAANNDLRIVAAAETHIHADFVSGAREIAERVDAKVYVSDEGDADWKYQWLDQKTGGGSYAHKLLNDGDSFNIGNIEFNVLHTPGHTPEHICFLVTDHGADATEPIGMLTGDFVFVGDLGRPDLLESAAGQKGAMEPSARRLYNTVSKLDSIPDFVQVWPAHGAGSACGKALGAVPMSTIGYERRFNPAIGAATNEQGFIDFILSGQPEPPLYFANMKRDNKAGPPVLGGIPNPPRVDIKTICELNPNEAAILDIRDWDSFRGAYTGLAIVPDPQLVPDRCGIDGERHGRHLPPHQRA